MYNIWRKHIILRKGYIWKKKIVVIRYYNVWFYLHVNSEQDMVKISYLTDRIDAGEQVVMKDIYQWCQRHGIKYNSKFVYRKRFSTESEYMELLFLSEGTQTME